MPKPPTPPDPTPTPRRVVSSSWNAFQKMALDLAARLVDGRVGKLSASTALRDPDGARRFLEMIDRLHEIAADFERWPSDPELAALQRVPHTAELFDLQREAEEEFLKMPGGPW